MKFFKTYIFLALALIMCGCDLEKPETSNDTIVGPDYSLTDSEFKGYEFRRYHGNHPDLLGEMSILLLQMPQETYKDSHNLTKNDITYYKTSDVLSSKSAHELQEDTKSKFEFLEYEIYYLRRNSFTVWINLPIEKNELVTEIIVQSTHDNKYTIENVYYFDLCKQDSSIVFEFAELLK